MTRFGMGFLAGPSGPRTFAQMIGDAGQSSGLVLCLDPADAACFDGSGQILADTSGNGNDYRRGTGLGATADPAFQGTVGDLAESTYLLFRGGDVLIEATAQTFSDTWHRDNAQFTVAALLFLPVGAARLPYIFCSGTGEYVALGYNGGGASSQQRRATIAVVKGGIVSVMSLSTANWFVTEGSWILLAYTGDETAGTFGASCNGAFAALAGGYAAPGTGTPGSSASIGANAAASSSYALAPGSRLGAIAAWNRALSQAQLAALYAQARRRWSSLPAL